MKINQGIVFVLIGLLAFAFGWGIQGQLANAREAAIRAEFIEQLGVIQEDIAVVKIQQHQTIEDVLRTSDNQQALFDQLATMDTKVDDLQYIVRARGQLSGSTPDPVIVERTALPPNHQYQLDGLTVAEFRVTELGDQVQYEFPTYDLQFETSLVLTDRQASVDVMAWSVFDPDTRVRVSTDTQAFDLHDEHKVLEPQVLLGLSSHFPTYQPAGSVSLSTIHPHRNVDVGNLRFSANTQWAGIGIDPIAYNIGGPLPVFTNLWIAPGVTFTSAGTIEPSLSLGAKL